MKSEREWGDPNNLDPEEDFKAWVGLELIVEYEKLWDQMAIGLIGEADDEE